MVELMGWYSKPRQQSNEPFAELLQMYQGGELVALEADLDNRPHG
jgi:hypothetical protein